MRRKCNKGHVDLDVNFITDKLLFEFRGVMCSLNSRQRVARLGTVIRGTVCSGCTFSKLASLALLIRLVTIVTD